MARKTWKDLEEEVRANATVIWGKSFHSTLIHGRQIDAYSADTNGGPTAIEVTEQKSIDKIQNDINKLVAVRNANFTQEGGYKSTRCIIVTAFEPTIHMRNACKSISVDIYDISEFRHVFLPFEIYRERREKKPFGSAVDPHTGARDNRQYVKVQLLDSDEGHATGDDVVDSITSGKRIVVIGEYGTGKSKLFEYIFGSLADLARKNAMFPISIDLRNIWGLKDRYEIIRRHLKDLDLQEYEDQFFRAYNAGYLLVMLDGFDEVSPQAWSDDPVGLRNLRADALAGARDILSNQSGGSIICGRDNYFDSHDEMLSALGLAAKSPDVFYSKDEFSSEEIGQFVKNAGLDIKVPEWLPRKPLTCEFFIKTLAEKDQNLSFDSDSPMQFWEVYFKSVCAREARLNPGFDPDAIGRVLVAVAAATRTKPQNVGPLSPMEIRAAFEKAVGYAPIEQASVLLQRLSGLGRTASDSEDRRFVDTYLLDGLRAMQVIGFVRKVEHESYLLEDWMNPLAELGRNIVAQKLVDMDLVPDALAFCNSVMRHKNHTLIGDVVSAVLISGVSEIDFNGLEVKGAHIGSLDLSEVEVANLRLQDDVISMISMPLISPKNLVVVDSIIENVEGVSAQSGMPSWLKGNQVGAYTSVANTSKIKAATIGAEHKVLVTILHKTFFQPGSARKEEALLRGLGKYAKPKTLTAIINKLISEGILTEERGDTGRLYSPKRSQTRRVGRIISELSMSKDAIWAYVGSLKN